MKGQIMIGFFCVTCAEQISDWVVDERVYRRQICEPCRYKERRGNALLAAFFGGMMVAFVPSIVGAVLGLTGVVLLAAWLGVWAVAGYAIYNKDMTRTSDPSES